MCIFLSFLVKIRTKYKEYLFLVRKKLIDICVFASMVSIEIFQWNAHHIQSHQFLCIILLKGCIIYLTDKITSVLPTPPSNQRKSANSVLGKLITILVKWLCQTHLINS
jgi:hypothetical protein